MNITKTTPYLNYLIRIIGILLLMGVMNCESETSSNSTSNPNMLVLAHKGGASLEPENSLKAFRVATAAVGADAIELDIHPTSDHLLIVNHDFTLNPSICLDPKGKSIKSPPRVSEMTFAEIREYDCGSLMGLPSKTPLASLDEVFEAVEKLKTPSGALPNYVVHIKWNPTTIDANDYIQIIMQTINKYNVIQRVSLLNDTVEILTAAQNLEPDIRLYYLVNQVAPNDIQIAKQLHVAALVPLGNSLTQPVVNTLHQANIKVIPWTVNDPTGWQSLMQMGVDGILTDDPASLKGYITGNKIDLDDIETFN